MYNQTGKLPEQLKPIDVPEEILYIWEWFCELSNNRRTGFSGIEPITYQDILAWVTLTRIPITPWEVDTLLKIDTLYRIKIMDTKPKTPNKIKGKK